MKERHKKEVTDLRLKLKQKDNEQLTQEEKLKMRLVVFVVELNGSNSATQN